MVVHKAYCFFLFPLAHSGTLDDASLLFQRSRGYISRVPTTVLGIVFKISVQKIEFDGSMLNAARIQEYSDAIAATGCPSERALLIIAP